jgi:hypothetical protein
MTCIAVKKDKEFIYLCGDTEVSYWRAHKMANTFKDSMKDFCKIMRIWDLYFWHSGHVEDSIVFKEYAKRNNPKGNRLSDIEEFVLWFYKHCKGRNTSRGLGDDRAVLLIIVYKWKAFFVWNYLIYEIDKYDSIWSWMFYAKTAMHLGKTASEAVDVAREFAWWVWWTTMEIKIPLSDNK